MALRGEAVILREVRDEDLPLLAEMRNDLETQGWSRTLPPDYTREMIRKRYADRPFEYRRDSGYFVVESRATGDAVGAAMYTDLVDRHEAQIGIMVSRAHWGSGLAFEGSDLLLRFLFEELGVVVIRLWTQTGNPRAVGLAEKLGFRVAIRFGEAIWKGGDYRDNLVMDLLREEWYERHPDLVDRRVDPFRAGGDGAR